MLHFCAWLQNNSLLVAINSSIVLSAMMEVAHYAGFFLLVGTIAIVICVFLAWQHAGRMSAHSERSFSRGCGWDWHPLSFLDSLCFPGTLPTSTWLPFSA